MNGAMLLFPETDRARPLPHPAACGGGTKKLRS
jgi:hypothetical protein